MYFRSFFSVTCFLFCAWDSLSFSTGAGNCFSARSYTHGHAPQAGNGGFHISIEDSDISGKSLISVSGARPFKGILLYVNKGSLTDLTSNYQFKMSCEDERGLYRSVTHMSSVPKSLISLGLELLPHDFSEFFLNVVIVVEFHEWYWINGTYSDFFQGAPPPSIYL